MGNPKSLASLADELEGWASGAYAAGRRPDVLSATEVVAQNWKVIVAALRAPTIARQFPILKGAPKSIPWDMIAPFEHYAEQNHCRQNLETLARRGGLSPLEAYAVLTSKHWEDVRELGVREAEVRLIAMVKEYESALATPSPTIAADPVERDTLVAAKAEHDEYHVVYYEDCVWCRSDNVDNLRKRISDLEAPTIAADDAEAADADSVEYANKVQSNLSRPDAFVWMIARNAYLAGRAALSTTSPDDRVEQNTSWALDKIRKTITESEKK